MYAIDTRLISINGKPLMAYSRDVNIGDTSLTVEAGTTGFCDPDEPLGKHTDEKKDDPTRTIIRIMCNEGDFCFRLIKKDGETIGATIATCGEEGLETLMRAILFASKVFRDECLELND